MQLKQMELERTWRQGYDEGEISITVWSPYSTELVNVDNGYASDTWYPRYYSKRTTVKRFTGSESMVV